MTARPQALATHSSPLAGELSVPSSLLRAAMSGLLVAGAGACTDDKSNGSASDSNSQELSEKELSALCSDMVTKAKETKPGPDTDALCADKVKEAKSECPAPKPPDIDALCADKVSMAKDMCPAAKEPDLDKLCEDKVKTATALKTREEKTTNAEQKEYTFAQLTSMCDGRGGYTQIHAACGSQNTCKGFSYGDWGPGAATLTEHSCSGANGCLGLSCNVLLEDKGNKTGAELYAMKFSDPGPGACTNCHAVANEADEDHPDVSKFKLYLLPGSTRSKSNWLDRSASEQERVIAFGAHGIAAGGPAYQNMAPYKDVLSRKQIERLVAHLRTLEVVVEPVKLADK